MIADENNEQFVKDLYYRVAEYEIHIPDLADRKEDIKPLVLLMISKISEETGKKISIRGEAIRVLEDHTWRGNARDVRNALKQIAIESPDGEITTAKHFFIRISYYMVSELHLQFTVRY